MNGIHATVVLRKADLLVEIALEDYARYPGTQEDLFAQEYGVDWRTIEAFCDVDGQIRCSATTRRGYRCKCFLPRLKFHDPKAWATRDAAGGYCFNHSGES